MKTFTQDEVERIVTDLLVAISKDTNAPAKVADESMEIINNTMDSYVFSGIVMTKIRPSIFNEREEDLKMDVMAYLQNMYNKCYELKKVESSFNSDLAENFDPNDIKNSYNTKMQFALSQFVNAFYAYDNLEKKYPELMKFM